MSDLHEITQKVLADYRKLISAIFQETQVDVISYDQADQLNLASMIDHTLLKQDAVPAQISKLCQEALQYQFATVCVNPTNIKQCAEILRGSEVKVCSVVGFPLGANLPSVKKYEAARLIAEGAQELDMVLNIGALKSGNIQLVLEDILGVVSESHAQGVLVKVIIETALLTQEEKVLAALCVKEAGADFVKTSTGFASGGATVEDIRLLRRIAGNTLKVKAAGGIRTRQDAISMVMAGATRIGASAGVQIIQKDQPAVNQQTEKTY